MRRDVTVQMALTLVLNIKGKYVTGEVFPSRTSINEVIPVLEDVLNAILKVRDGIGVRVPKLNVVVAGFADRAI
jgi:hypothetical protein